MNKFSINELVYLCNMVRYNHLNLVPTTSCDISENLDVNLQQKGILDDTNAPTLLGNELLKMIVEYNTCPTYFTFSNYYVGHSNDNNIIIVDDEANYSIFNITNHELLNLLYIIVEKMVDNQLITNNNKNEIELTFDEFQEFCKKHENITYLEINKFRNRNNIVDGIFIFEYCNSIVVFMLFEDKLTYHTQESFFEFLRQFLLS